MATATNVRVYRDSALGDRVLVAVWDWTPPIANTTESYTVRWGYMTNLGFPYLGEEESVSARNPRNSSYTIPDGAVKVWVSVRPISTTYRSNNTDVNYWTATTSAQAFWYDMSDALPEIAAPAVTLDGSTLTATLTTEVLDHGVFDNAIEFQIVQDNARTYDTKRVRITYAAASVTCEVPLGHEYKVRCRLVQYPGTSGAAFTVRSTDWSTFSESYETPPASGPVITNCKSKTATSVLLEWSPSPGAETYTIEYTTDRSLFDMSDSVNSISGIEATRRIIEGLEYHNDDPLSGLLETDNMYFFRVRGVKTTDGGWETAWSSIKSIIIGTEPAAPTTWSSKSTARISEPVTLYWVHNAEDGSSETSAQISVSVTDSQGNSETKTSTIQNLQYGEDQDRTNSCLLSSVLSVSPPIINLADGDTVSWKIRTAGAKEDSQGHAVYGDWSIERTITFYASPEVHLDIVDSEETSVTTVTTLPFFLAINTTPSTQVPIGCHVSVASNSYYETLDPVGYRKVVSAGEEVYSKYFDSISSPQLLEFSANNISLENNMSYTVTCSVTMNSGLTAESTFIFDVVFDSSDSYEPNAEIGIEKGSISAYIRPYCNDSEGNLAANILLSVYRRESDGSLVKISSGIANTGTIYANDPHPALNYALYRIVATNSQTGQVTYYDIPAYPVMEKSVVIQWDEEWQNFESTDENILADRPWSGSVLKLPYNIDVSDSNSMDVSLISYMGRKHPVSYYGTQLGASSSWNVDIDKNDLETLYALRRLASWTGDVYVREPSGTGYWANIAVSYGVKHLETTIPVSFAVTRVEGGI